MVYDDYNALSRKRRALRYWIMYQHKIFKGIKNCNKEIMNINLREKEFELTIENSTLIDLIQIELEERWYEYRRSRMFIKWYEDDLLRNNNLTG